MTAVTTQYTSLTLLSQFSGLDGLHYKHMSQLIDIVQPRTQPPTAGDVLEIVDLLRADVARRLDPDRQTQLGQFFTPAPVASLLASIFEVKGRSVRLLDAGAGVGSLTAAFVAELCTREVRPQELRVTAYEIDGELAGTLRTTLDLCGQVCESRGIDFRSEVIEEDFIGAAVMALQGELFGTLNGFDCAILNPPYKKIGSGSPERQLLREVGVETSNLYTAFLSLTARLLEEDGELVAVTPRSFCNGPYFRAFRRDFLGMMALHRMHVFESRDRAFDEVLQENVVFRAVKAAPPAAVTITSSRDPLDEVPTHREVPYERVIQPTDPESFIHIVTDDLGSRVAAWMAQFSHSLDDLGLTVSTGRVVDFRAKAYLRLAPGEGTVPLIYPHNLTLGMVTWPLAKNGKPQALLRSPKTETLLVPSGSYILVKRFTSKEERRRVVAAVYEPGPEAGEVGFENHLNYFHENGAGLGGELAKGLAAFLNSTMFDEYLRQFSGHTQVNATDLRNIRYPSRDQLEALGREIGKTPFPSQDALDKVMAMAFSQRDGGSDPVQVKKRIEEATTVLASLGLPRAQLNERSALTLLALLNLKPETSWADADAPLMGITPIMDYMAEHYGKTYKPNTRETVRRQTMHQFVDAGIAVSNPDRPDRPPNSPKWVYQIEPAALKLLRTYGTPEWEEALETYLETTETLRERYAQRRKMARIPVTINKGLELTLSPGGQNELVERIINEFCPPLRARR